MWLISVHWSSLTLPIGSSLCILGLLLVLMFGDVEIHDFYSSWDGQVMLNVWNKEFWLEDLRERDNLEHLNVGGRTILKWTFKKYDWKTFTGLTRLRIWTGRGLLWTRWWTVVFHKMQKMSWLAENLLATQEGLWSVELVDGCVMLSM